MKIKIIFFVTSLTLSILLFSSCSNKKPALGSEDEIIVLADSTLYYELEGELLEAFGEVIYTPQPENLFTLIRKDYTELKNNNKRKNIIILGTLSDTGYVSQYLQSSLDSNVTELVKRNEEHRINKYDLWADGQLVMFLVSPNIDQLRFNILKHQDELLYSFRNISYKRLTAKLSGHRVTDKEKEAKLLSDYGWTIYILKYFDIAKNSPEENFVWFRTGRNTPMERWIFVHWIENASPEYLNEDSIFAIRNRITKKHFRTSDEDEFVEISSELSQPMHTEVNFNSRYGIMTQGFWRFDDKSGGGPFTSYSLFDEESERFYMIDGSIYAPKYYKKELIQRIDVILNSFRLESDLGEVAKAELLEELD